MQIQQHHVVAFHYSLKNECGEELDSSAGQLPQLYLHGHDNIVRGLEKALAGRAIGDALQVVVEPEEGYGLHDPELVQQVPRSAIEALGPISLGMQFQAHTEDGPIPVKVVAFDEATVTVDGNHPLAGERLYFSVQIRHVREASEEELANGFPEAD